MARHTLIKRSNVRRMFDRYMLMHQAFDERIRSMTSLEFVRRLDLLTEFRESGRAPYAFKPLLDDWTLNEMLTASEAVAPRSEESADVGIAEEIPRVGASFDRPRVEPDRLGVS